MARQTRLRTALSAAGMAVAGLAAFMPLATAADMRGDGQPTAIAERRPAPDSQPAAPSELAREGMAKMLQALNKLIESVPQFQMPEMTENGDIILRRKRPDAPAPPAQSPDQPDNRAI